MRHSLLLSALVATAISGIAPAFAADEDVPPEFRSSTFEVYTGVFGAANTIRSSYTDGETVDPIAGSLDGTGFGFGIRGGADYVMDGWLVGAVGDWTFGNRVAKEAQNNADADLRNLGTLRARTGVMLGNSLVYLTGGLARAQVNLGLQEDVANINGSQKYWSTSWTLGGGMDVGITDSLSLGVEYLYVDVKNKTLALPTDTDPVDIDYNVKGIHTIRVGMNYAFKI